MSSMIAENVKVIVSFRGKKTVSSLSGSILELQAKVAAEASSRGDDDANKVTLTTKDIKLMYKGKVLPFSDDKDSLSTFLKEKNPVAKKFRLMAAGISAEESAALADLEATKKKKKEGRMSTEKHSLAVAKSIFDQLASQLPAGIDPHSLIHIGVNGHRMTKEQLEEQGGDEDAGEGTRPSSSNETDPDAVDESP